jgi:replicative DNA helicase
MAEIKSIRANITSSDTNFRKPPFNTEAEQYILGAVINNNENVNKIADFLLPEHFYEPVHQKIYQTILNFFDKGIPANAVTMKNHFEGDESLKEVGGATYLLKLSGFASGIINVREYAQMVYNMFVARQLIDIGEDMVNDAFKTTGEDTANLQIEKSEQKLFTLASEGVSESNFTQIKTSLGKAIEIATLAAKQGGDISGVATKFTAIDNLLGGFNNSDLIILAARPSMGKTALAINFAINGAEALMEKYEKELEANKANPDYKPGSVGFISLEMSSEQLATRMLSIKTDINAANIRRGKLSKEPHNDEFTKLIKASSELYKLPIFIDDTPALSISAIRTRARRMKRKHNLSFLLIDYLQLIRGSSSRANENRVQEISEITMGLKAIAKELNIPIIALSQLSRTVESLKPPRPQLSHLRESGSIEQDADIVMFIYRESYYKEREKPSEDNYEEMRKWQEDMEKIRNVSEIMIAKNRNGPINNVRLFFDNNTTRFGDFAGDAYVDYE